jgi:hypothetical protein
MSDIPAPVYDTQPNPESGFLGLYTTEDMALKAQLSGLTVTDLNASEATPRPVPVWFHNPEREERRITYPSIIISFDGERVAHEREHRAWTQFHYWYLQNVPFDDAFPVFKDWPIPMDFDYTVTVQARINQHISQMCGALAMGPLHPRFAVVECPGGTLRRLEVLGSSRVTAMEADKRLFKQIYRVRMPTEIEDLVAISMTRVREVILRVVAKDTNQDFSHPLSIDAVQPTYFPSVDTGQYQSQTAGE